MRFLLNYSPALTGKIPAWFTSDASFHWLPNHQIILRTYLQRQNLFQESSTSVQKRLISRFVRRLSCLQKCASKYERIWHISGHNFSSSSRYNCLPSYTLLGEVDRYQGVWVDLSKPGNDKLTLDFLREKDFDSLLKDSLETWRGQGVTSVWLHFSLTQGHFLPVASKYGFTFHHAEGDKATLVLWIDKDQESKIPMFATHQVGVSGLVIKEDTHEVLVVQDKNRPFKLWKFPGGLSDLGEDIATTAEREVFEETGLKTEFQSVLAFRQHHSLPGAFGRSDLYIICRLKPLTFDLQPCVKEIAACKWMPVEQLKKEVQISSMTHKLVDLVLLGLKNGFEHVDISSYEMASLHKGLKFHLFHRPIQ